VVLVAFFERMTPETHGNAERRHSPTTCKWKKTIMKSIRFLSAAAMILVFVGCATPPVVVAPVGPKSAKVESAASMGSLEVFSRIVEQNHS
jgi:hypothetical protein